MKSGMRIALLCGLAALVAMPIVLAAQTQHLPISAWVDLLPPTSYQYWTTQTMDRVLYIDAWGKRAGAFGLNVGTTIDGSVAVRKAEPGKVEVTVTALTRNAICWGSQLSGSAYIGVFGRTPRQLNDNHAYVASLGDALHKFVFLAPANAPLPPDGAIGTEDYPIQSMSAVVNCSGELRAASGYPDGTPGKAHATQQGRFAAGGTGHCPAGDCWPAEVVNFWPLIAR